MPSASLPSAGACVLLLLTLFSHALFHLLCHWLVSFRAAALYRAVQPSDRSKSKSAGSSSASSSPLDESCFVLVVPPPNRGKADLVPLRRAALGQALQLEFQRQAYVYTPSAKLG